ncbi:MAG: serpin family protein [Bacteroidales bacterium]|nr:serpin family protein [Bacteroidales bacterium]
MSLKHSFYFIAVAATLLLGASACKDRLQSDDPGDNPYRELALSLKGREYVSAGAQFSMDFLDRINASEKGSYVVSPLSLQFLLGMILSGAQGETAGQICRVLGYGAGETADVNEFCRSMIEQLPALDKATTLKIANAVAVNQNVSLLGSYRKSIANDYEAQVSAMDFSDAKGTVKKINQWCSDHTEGLIPEVLKEDQVSEDMLAFLMNALYFKSKWANPFDRSNTQEETFTDEAGKASKVKMMRQSAQLPYRETDRYQAVRLGYGNGAYAMLILLPREKCTVSDVVKALKALGDPSGVSMPERQVELSLPRFETKFHIELSDMLAAMGMPLAFSPAADFSAMSKVPAYLDFVQQDAVIKVDEEGSEAAAISIGGMRKNTSIGGQGPVTFRADRPFLYLITERSTGAILFAGRYSGK